MEETKEDALIRIRFLASITQNSAPPHCHPITILLITLSIGIIFVGMTMTIVAHWPGSVSVGFDPLSIPGPIILALGGALLICTILLIWYFNTKEKDRKKKKLLNFALQKSNLNVSSSSSKHHHHYLHRSLEFEPTTRKSQIESQVGEDEPDVRLLHDYGDDGADGGTATTTNDGMYRSPASTNETSSSPQDDTIPEPIRSHSKIPKKSGKKKERIISEMPETTEVGEWEEDPDSGDAAHHKVFKTTTTTTTTTVKQTKKKKINTNYSRDNVLANFESKQSQEVGGTGQRPVDDVERSVRVQVKVPPGTNVNIRNL
ncbi:hypothetical protein HELRODRAFT_194081 [Helobdella robusta]|uniref:Uncharacterized protein n=1 Tax=Helobdella robusta TaxID=6412 RepID=T1FVN3_HELRO|nr:hypothetical protein HELRODRAFT_194081 [Helobdella robusta]ESN93386.1 hypothetical protein HELRODRAFT_194081 [Helobdella robusta]